MVQGWPSIKQVPAVETSVVHLSMKSSQTGETKVFKSYHKTNQADLDDLQLPLMYVKHLDRMLSTVETHERNVRGANQESPVGPDPMGWEDSGENYGSCTIITSVPVNRIVCVTSPDKFQQ